MEVPNRRADGSRSHRCSPQDVTPAHHICSYLAVMKDGHTNSSHRPRERSLKPGDSYDHHRTPARRLAHRSGRHFPGRADTGFPRHVLRTLRARAPRPPSLRRQMRLWAADHAWYRSVTHDDAVHAAMCPRVSGLSAVGDHWAAESQVERWRTSASEVPTLAETAKRFGVPAPRRGLLRQLRPQHPGLAPSTAPIAPRPDHRSPIAAGPPPSQEQHLGLTNSIQES